MPGSRADRSPEERKERRKEASRRSYLRHRDQTLARQRAYYEGHKVEIEVRRKAARMLRLESFRRQRCEASHRRRARLRQVVVEEIDLLEIAKRDGGKCHLCHKRVPLQEMTLDHLNPLFFGGNHTVDNVALAHGICNYRRGAGRRPAQLRLLA
jgi:5-methylcytosine-specific restriction endonuclease McrA